MTKDYHIIKTIDQLNALFGYLAPHQGCVISVDTETSSANPRNCTLMGVSLSIRPGEAFYIVLNEYDGKGIISTDVEEPHFYTTVKNSLQVLLKTCQVIMHNAAFDIMVFRQTMNLDLLPYLYMDTILMKHLADEKRPHGLKEIISKWLGPEFDNEEQKELKASVLKRKGKWNKNHKDIYMAHTHILGAYAAADADLTLQLFYKLYEALEKDNLLHFYFDETHPLLKVIINHLLERGVYCDIPYFETLKMELTQKMQELEQQSHKELITSYPNHYYDIEREILEKEFPFKQRGKLAKLVKAQNLTSEDDIEQRIYTLRKQLYQDKHKTNYIVNLQSTKQLKQLLFDKLGENPTKQTKKGNNQVDNEVMTQFAERYDWVKALMEYRKMSKLLNTYVDNILERQKDNVIYPNWLQFGTDSGRFASNNINCQNLPSNDTTIKKGIVARPGYVLIGTDYSQLEPRIFAHMSNEYTLINAFHKNEDFYGTLAIDIFNLDCTPNEVKDKYPEERAKSKTIGLALAYGCKKWRLAHLLGIETEEAQEIIDKYFQTYTSLHRFINISHGEAIKYKFVRNELGRYRRFPDINKLKYSPEKNDQYIYNKLLNLSINFKIQSLAASIINRAMVNIDKKIQEKSYDAHIIMQIHDELIVECKKEQAPYVAQIIKEGMENVYQLKVPLKAEPKIATKLSEAK